MSAQITTHMLANNITHSLSTGNMFIDSILSIIVVNIISSILTNMSIFQCLLNICQYFASYFKNNKYTFVIEYEATLTEKSSWEVNRERYGHNIELIDAVYSYIDKYNTHTTHTTVTLRDNNQGDDDYSRDTNKLKLYKPSTIIKLREPFANIYIEPLEKTIDSNNKRIITSSLHITGQNNEQIKNFIDQCYKEYVDIKHRDCKSNLSNIYLYLPVIQTTLTFNRIKISPLKTFENIFFDDKVRLTSYLDKFLANKTNSSRFTLLLHGPPGTGKTSIIKALSNYTKRHLVYVKLSEITTFQHALDIFFNENIKVHSTPRVFEMADSRIIQNLKLPVNKRIIILEDIDVESNIVHQRRLHVIDDNNVVEISMKDNKIESKNKFKSGLTLSDVLQLFDGVVETEGTIIVMTTNNVSILDDALIRPGRVTMKLFLGTLSTECATQMIRYHFPKGNITNLPIKPNTITPCELENLCKESNSISDLRTLLTKYYTDYDTKHLSLRPPS